MEGIIGIKPEIKKIIWERLSRICFYLKDGRVIIMPSKLLPCSKKVKPKARSRPQLINGGAMFTWVGCPEVYHIEQILGKESEYKYV